METTKCSHQTDRFLDEIPTHEVLVEEYLSEGGVRPTPGRDCLHARGDYLFAPNGQQRIVDKVLWLPVMRFKGLPDDYPYFWRWFCVTRDPGDPTMQLGMGPDNLYMTV